MALCMSRVAAAEFFNGFVITGTGHFILLIFAGLLAGITHIVAGLLIGPARRIFVLLAEIQARLRMCSLLIATAFPRPCCHFSVTPLGYHFLLRITHRRSIGLGAPLIAQISLPDARHRIASIATNRHEGARSANPRLHGGYAEHRRIAEWEVRKKCLTSITLIGHQWMDEASIDCFMIRMSPFFTASATHAVLLHAAHREFSCRNSSRLIKHLLGCTGN